MSGYRKGNKYRYYYRNSKTSDSTKDPYKYTGYVPPEPLKPYLKNYDLSEKVFNSYEQNPEKVAHHRKFAKFDIGCFFPLVLLGVVFLLLLSYTELSKRVAIILFCVLAGTVIVYHFINSRISLRLFQYDRYKNACIEYEKQLQRYTIAVKEKEDFELKVAQEKERIEREHKAEEQRKIRRQQEIQDYISGYKGSLVLQEIKRGLSSFEVFQHRSVEEWREMSWRDFELEVGEIYRRLGYNVKVTQASIDNGVDIVLHKDNKLTLVQCKHYEKNVHIGSPELQAFCGVCVQYGAKGEFVYTSYLTKQAQKYIEEETISKIIKPVSLETLIEYDIQGGRLVEKEQEDDFLFRADIASSNDYVECNNFWLYKKLFSDLEQAKKQLATFDEYKGKSFAILSRHSEELNILLYYIVIGGKESIRQLGRKRELLAISPSANG